MRRSRRAASACCAQKIVQQGQCREVQGAVGESSSVLSVLLQQVCKTFCGDHQVLCTLCESELQGTVRVGYELQGTVRVRCVRCKHLCVWLRQCSPNIRWYRSIHVACGQSMNFTQALHKQRDT